MKPSIKSGWLCWPGATGAALLWLLTPLTAQATCYVNFHTLYSYYSSGQVMTYDQSPPLWTPLVPLPVSGFNGIQKSYHEVSCDTLGDIKKGDSARIDLQIMATPLQMLPAGNSGDGKSYMVYRTGGAAEPYFGVIVKALSVSTGHLEPVTLQTGEVFAGPFTLKLQHDLGEPSWFVTQGQMTVVTLGTPVPPGVYPIAPILFDRSIFYHNGNVRPELADNGYTPAMTVIIRSKTCSISAPSVVELPNVNTGAFGVAGSVANITQNVPVTVNCVASPGFASTQVSAVFTDAQDSFNRTNLLTKGGTDSSNAKIGLYLDSTQNQLTFGPDSTNVDTVNSFSVGTVGSSGGTLSIPLVAAYVATANTTTPGTVSGRATMTIIYQ